MTRLSTTLRYTFSGLRWQIIGWGLGIALYGLFIVVMYESMAGDPAQFSQIINSYPAEFLAFFGADANSMLTPASYLRMYAFSMLPVIMGVFAVIAGSGLIVSDEEHGRLDLIIAHPVGRPAFFWGRVLGFIAATASIFIIAWLGFSVLLGRSSLGITWAQMAIPFLPLVGQILLYGMLGLMLSMLLPSRNIAAMVTAAIMIVSYLVSSLSFLNQGVAAVAKILPYHYFQAVMSLDELRIDWLIAILGISLAMTVVAYFRFYRRDIRLSGEGSWRRK